jgi:hypothetical protein
MLFIKHQSRYFDVLYTGISFNQISLFQHPQLCQNSIALVITIIEINLDDHVHFFNTTNISQSFSRASMTNNTILYRMKDLKGATGGVT